MFSRERGIQLKTPAQIGAMRKAGLVVGRTLEVLRDAVVPGISTTELDAIAEEHIRASGAIPSFKGYQGFPATICVSVDDEVVHGIPGPRRLADGDLVSLDCGAIVDGWHGDAAITVAVGEVTPEHAELGRVCEEALWRGLAAAVTGGRLGDISAAVEAYVREASGRRGNGIGNRNGNGNGNGLGSGNGIDEARRDPPPPLWRRGAARLGHRGSVRAVAGGYGIVEEYVGHGIGTEMHQPPDVPNIGRAGRGLELVPGLVIAVEPMITLGSRQTAVLEDDWTVVTVDGAYAAHAEHTVAITPAGPWVLTALDGGAARLAELGVRCGAPRDTASGQARG